MKPRGERRCAIILLLMRRRPARGTSSTSRDFTPSQSTERWYHAAEPLPGCPLLNLPEDVVAFIDEQIDSVSHLEALLLIAEEPSKSWTEEELALRVYVEKAVARGILQDLVRRRLVAADAITAYRYDPSWDPGTARAWLPSPAPTGSI